MRTRASDRARPGPGTAGARLAGGRLCARVTSHLAELAGAARLDRYTTPGAPARLVLLSGHDTSLLAVLNALDRVTGGSRDVALVARTTYGEHPAQKLRFYAPADAAGPLPVFVFVHGGSWSWGDPDDYDFVARAIAPAGFVTVLAFTVSGHDVLPSSQLEEDARRERAEWKSSSNYSKATASNKEKDKPSTS